MSDLKREFAVYNLPNGFLDAREVHADRGLSLPEGVGTCCFVFAESVSGAVHKHVAQVAQDQGRDIADVHFGEMALA